jgi:hypothetical protein
MTRKAKRKERNIIEAFDYRGFHIEIEEIQGRGGPIYSAHHSRDGFRCTLAPYFSIEEIRKGIKQAIDAEVAA